MWFLPQIGPFDPRLAPPYQLAHHTKGKGEVRTLPGGTRYEVYPFNSNDGTVEHPLPNEPRMGVVGAPGEYDVLTYLDGNPAEFSEFIGKLYREGAPPKKVEDVDRNYIEPHRYWDALKRGMAGTGPYPKGIDWLSDLVIRRSGPGM